MAEQTSSLLSSSPEQASLRKDPPRLSPRARTVQVLFVGTVIVMVLTTVCLSIYRGVVNTEAGALYFMLGISLVGFVIVELFMIYFIRRGELPTEKTWFLYFVGGCVILESVFTNVLLFK